MLEDHGGRIELKDASDFHPGQRGAWMRLRFAVTGHAPKEAHKEAPEDAPRPESEEGAPTKQTAAEQGSEKKQPAAETSEPAGTTNDQAKIKAATGD